MGISREFFSRIPQAETSVKKDLAPYTITIPVADARVITMLISRWQDKDSQKLTDAGDTYVTEQRLYSYGTLFALIEGEAHSSAVVTVCANSKKELEDKFQLLSNLLNSYSQEVRQDELGNIEHVTVSEDWAKRMMHASPVLLRTKFPRIIHSYTGKHFN